MFRESLFPGSVERATLSAEQRQAINDRNSAKRKEMSAKLQEVMAAAEKQAATGKGQAEKVPAADEKPLEPQVASVLRAGWVSIADPWGHLVARTRAALIKGSWLALPTRTAYAGYQWTFSRDSGVVNEIDSGVWRPGDAVGLWHLSASTSAADGLSLSPWSSGEPLLWMSLDSQREISDIRLVPGLRQGDFVACSPPEGIDENGVFLQGSNIVGWSFGPWLSSVYLWGGKSEAELEPMTNVHSFYAATFAKGREEKFAGALALKEEHTDLERLAALLAGFAERPKLALEDTPQYLTPGEVVKQIRQLVTQLLRSGQGAQLVGLLDDGVLLAIGDLKLLLDIVPAITANQGFEPAIQKIESVGRQLVERGGVDVPAVNEVHLKLYQEWLQSLVTVKAVSEAVTVLMTAKAFYPNDPYLHLLAVELALLQNDWQEAERLLAMMQYPARFRDRYELLSRRISEMKGDEGTIVIRFQPGGSRIPLAAGLNQALRQNFIVDTGASMVTIPSATAESLNLQMVQGHHGGRRTVSTAGGMVDAYEVLIESVEINGWVEHNVGALVMDIPGQPGVGLLGLNYLDRFKVSLNSNEGKLTLRPK
ncbi:MAG: retropepsin-like aspartic protease [Desulfobulbaceae bacterium]|nr:retropepsin-like aspartic protease [Desulfobulbaceae bacterium]